MYAHVLRGGLATQPHLVVDFGLFLPLWYEISTSSNPFYIYSILSLEPFRQVLIPRFVAGADLSGFLFMNYVFGFTSLFFSVVFILFVWFWYSIFSLFSAVYFMFLLGLSSALVAVKFAFQLFCSPIFDLVLVCTSLLTGYVIAPLYHLLLGIWVDSMFYLRLTGLAQASSYSFIPFDRLADGSIIFFQSVAFSIFFFFKAKILFLVKLGYYLSAIITDAVYLLFYFPYRGFSALVSFLPRTPHVPFLHLSYYPRLERIWEYHIYNDFWYYYYVYVRQYGRIALSIGLQIYHAVVDFWYGKLYSHGVLDHLNEFLKSKPISKRFGSHTVTNIFWFLNYCLSSLKFFLLLLGYYFGFFVRLLFEIFLPNLIRLLFIFFDPSWFEFATRLLADVENFFLSLFKWIYEMVRLEYRTGFWKKLIWKKTLFALHIISHGGAHDTAELFYYYYPRSLFAYLVPKTFLGYSSVVYAFSDIAYYLARVQLIFRLISADVNFQLQILTDTEFFRSAAFFVFSVKQFFLQIVYPYLLVPLVTSPVSFVLNLLFIIGQQAFLVALSIFLALLKCLLVLLSFPISFIKFLCTTYWWTIADALSIRENFFYSFMVLLQTPIWLFLFTPLYFLQAFVSMFPRIVCFYLAIFTIVFMVVYFVNNVYLAIRTYRYFRLGMLLIHTRRQFAELPFLMEIDKKLRHVEIAEEINRLGLDKSKELSLWRQHPAKARIFYRQWYDGGHNHFRSRVWRTWPVLINREEGTWDDFQTCLIPRYSYGFGDPSIMAYFRRSDEFYHFVDYLKHLRYAFMRPLFLAHQLYFAARLAPSVSHQISTKHYDLSTKLYPWYARWYYRFVYTGSHSVKEFGLTKNYSYGRVLAMLVTIFTFLRRTFPIVGVRFAEWSFGRRYFNINWIYYPVFWIYYLFVFTPGIGLAYASALVGKMARRIYSEFVRRGW